ncbi:MAG: energy-coupling factor ABC transporter permease, partial [Thermoplasmata archaeon]
MHIPDGLMAPELVVIGWIFSILGLGIAVRAVKRNLPEKQIVLMAVITAGIFAAQMLNFPVTGGTSGHLVGAALASIIFGPAAAIVMISTILIIQCLVFGDGGLTALGLNILNMALIGSIVSYYTYSLISGKPKDNKTFKFDAKGRIAIFAGAWSSTFVSALFCAIELSISNMLSPTYGITWQISIPMMAL